MQQRSSHRTLNHAESRPGHQWLRGSRIVRTTPLFERLGLAASQRRAMALCSLRRPTKYGATERIRTAVRKASMDSIRVIRPGSAASGTQRRDIETVRGGSGPCPRPPTSRLSRTV